MVLMAAALAGGCATSTGPSAERELDAGADAAKHGYWREAGFRFARALELRPDDPRILNNLAVSYEALGRYDDARAAYERGLDLDPNDRALRGNLERMQEFVDTYLDPPEERDPAAEVSGGERAGTDAVPADAPPPDRGSGTVGGTR